MVTFQSVVLPGCGSQNAVCIVNVLGWSSFQRLQSELMTEQLMLADGMPIAHIMADGYVQLLDWGGRTLVGMLKPFVVDAPPPGAYGNLVLVPLVAIALWFALPRRADVGEDA